MVAGNWKMNKTLQEGVALATELKEKVANPRCEVVIATPFIHLATVAELLNDSPIRVAAEKAPDSILCLNADCSLTASLKDDIDNDIVMYGVNLPIYKARKVVQTLFSFSGTGFIQGKI